MIIPLDQLGATKGVAKVGHESVRRCRIQERPAVVASIMSWNRNGRAAKAAVNGAVAGPSTSSCHPNERVWNSHRPHRRINSNPTSGSCSVSIRYSTRRGVDGRPAPKHAPLLATGTRFLKNWITFHTSSIIRLATGRAAFKSFAATRYYTKKLTATQRAPIAKSGTAAVHATTKMTTVSQSAQPQTIYFDIFMIIHFVAEQNTNTARQRWSRAKVSAMAPDEITRNHTSTIRNWRCSRNAACRPVRTEASLICPTTCSCVLSAGEKRRPAGGRGK